MDDEGRFQIRSWLGCDSVTAELQGTPLRVSQGVSGSMAEGTTRKKQKDQTYVLCFNNGWVAMMGNAMHAKVPIQIYSHSKPFKR